MVRGKLARKGHMDRLAQTPLAGFSMASWQLCQQPETHPLLTIVCQSCQASECQHAITWQDQVGTHHAVLLDHVQAQLLLRDEHLGRYRGGCTSNLGTRGVHTISIHHTQPASRAATQRRLPCRLLICAPSAAQQNTPSRPAAQPRTWLASGTIFCAKRLTRSLKVAENSRIC